VKKHFDEVHEPEVVVKTLKELKRKNVIKHEKGAAFLDVSCFPGVLNSVDVADSQLQETIANAEAGFAKVYTVQEAWEKVF